MPHKLIFFSAGDELRIQATRQIVYLNDANTTFLDFLKSLFGMDILNKNKIKIHLEIHLEIFILETLTLVKVFTTF